MGGCACWCAGPLDRWEMVVEKNTKKNGPMSLLSGSRIQANAPIPVKYFSADCVLPAGGRGASCLK